MVYGNQLPVLDNMRLHLSLILSKCGLSLLSFQGDQGGSGPKGAMGLQGPRGAVGSPGSTGDPGKQV